MTCCNFLSSCRCRYYTFGISNADKHSLLILSNSDVFKYQPTFLCPFDCSSPSSIVLHLFSLFTADPEGRRTCLLTPSREGAGRELAIAMSKYVHAKSTLLTGTVGRLLRQDRETTLWSHVPSFTTFILFLRGHGVRQASRMYKSQDSVGRSEKANKWARTLCFATQL